MDVTLKNKIDWINALLILPFESESGKMTDIAFAYMDLMEYCMDKGIVGPDLQFPEKLASQLENVWKYLGEPA